MVVDGAAAFGLASRTNVLAAPAPRMVSAFPLTENVVYDEPARTRIVSPDCAAATAAGRSVKCVPGPFAWSTIQMDGVATARMAIVSSIMSTSGPRSYRIGAQLPRKDLERRR